MSISSLNQMFLKRYFKMYFLISLRRFFFHVTCFDRLICLLVPPLLIQILKIYLAFFFQNVLFFSQNIPIIAQNTIGQQRFFKRVQCFSFRFCSERTAQYERMHLISFHSSETCSQFWKRFRVFCQCHRSVKTKTINDKN